MSASGLKCVKCGSEDVRTFWHARGYPYRGGCGYGDHSLNVEHLHRYCQGCHFDWTDKPLDALLGKP